MPMISLSEDFIKLRKEKIEEIRKRRESDKKIVLIFKKRYNISDKEDMKKLYEDLEKLNKNNLYDEIYIVKNDIVFTESEMKKIYEDIKKKEDEELKERVLELSKVIEKMIKVVKLIKKYRS